MTQHVLPFLEDSNDSTRAPAFRDLKASYQNESAISKAQWPPGPAFAHLENNISEPRMQLDGLA